MKGNHVWALLYDYDPALEPVPGPPYWFRHRAEAQRFADQSKAVYPYMPKLVAVRFKVWPHSALYWFDASKQSHPIMIAHLDDKWFALRVLTTMEMGNLKFIWGSTPLRLTT